MLLLLLKENPQMTAQGLAEILGKSKRQIERIIAGLQADRKWERIGASKSGYWVVRNEKQFLTGVPNVVNSRTG